MSRLFDMSQGRPDGQRDQRDPIDPNLLRPARDLEALQIRLVEGPDHLRPQTSKAEPWGHSQVP